MVNEAHVDDDSVELAESWHTPNLRTETGTGNDGPPVQIRIAAVTDQHLRQDCRQRHDPDAAGIDAKLYKRCGRLGIPAVSHAHTDDSIALERRG